MIILPEGYCAERETQVLAFADGGLPELMAWLEATPLVKRGRGNGGSTDEPDDFNGYSTWSEVVRWTKTGWQEGADRILHGFPRPTFTAIAKRPKWGYDVAGETPDIGRFLGGDPLYMRNNRAERGRAKTVVLYIGMGIRAGVTTKEFANFGVAVCQMIDALENSGTRVELNQATRCIMGNAAVTGWRVKEAGDPLDMAALAFTYMHPAAHRRLQFQFRNRVGTGYVGGSTTITTDDVPDAPAGAVVMAGISDAAGKCNTVSAAREFLRTRINEGVGSELVTLDMLDHLEGEAA